MGGVRAAPPPARKVCGKPYVGWFDPNDFMLMDESLSDGRRFGNYKHRITRRSMQLDDSGQPWGAAVARRGKSRRGVRSDHALAAFDAIGIWELPWMKESLHASRRVTARRIGRSIRS